MADEKSKLDKGLLSILVTLCFAVLAGGIAWGSNVTKINQTAVKVDNIEKNLSKRMDRMGKRTDKRFDRLDRKLKEILRAIRRQ